MLDLRRMRLLREVAAKGSFSAAAKALSFTQPAVSRQIALLEREAGTVLVERTPRGIRLTDAGRLVVEHTDAILARLAATEAQLEELSELKRGRVRLGAFATAFPHLVADAVAFFRAQYPGVDLSLAEVGREESVHRLRTGALDIALVFEHDLVPLEPTDEIEQLHLLDDPMYLALPRAHPLADVEELRLEALVHDSWIQGTQGPFATLIERACLAAGFQPRVVFVGDDQVAIQGLVAAGLGVSLIPGLGLSVVHPDVVLRSLGPQTPIRRVLAATLAGGYRSEAAHRMLEALQRSAGRFRDTRMPMPTARIDAQEDDPDLD